jgi:hypothetical protein
MQGDLRIVTSVIGDGVNTSFSFSLFSAIVKYADNSEISPDKFVRDLPDAVNPIPNAVLGSPTLTATLSLSKDIVTVVFSSAPGSGVEYEVALSLLYNSL